MLDLIGAILSAAGLCITIWHRRNPSAEQADHRAALTSILNTQILAHSSLERLEATLAQKNFVLQEERRVPRSLITHSLLSTLAEARTPDSNALPLFYDGSGGARIYQVPKTAIRTIVESPAPNETTGPLPDRQSSRDTPADIAMAIELLSNNKPGLASELLLAMLPRQKLNELDLTRYNILSVCMLRMGRPEDALKYLQAGIDKVENFCDINLFHNLQFNMGVALYELGRYRDACTKFEALIAFPPLQRKAFNALVDIHSRLAERKP